MKTAPNRVLTAFKSWEDRKKEMEPLLKDSNPEILDQLKLAHLQQAAHRLNAQPRADERPFMLLLQNQISKLEKQLYPNFIVRLFFKLKDRLFDGPNYLRRQAAQRTANMRQLKQQLRDQGLSSFAGQLEDHLDPELKTTSIPLACQLNEEKRLHFTLNFEQDQQGDFQMNSFHAALKLHGVTSKAQHFELKDWPGLQTNQAWSLLEGRALKQNFIDASGQESQRWVELSPSGIQHYAPDHDFDIKTAIAGIPNISGSKPEMIRYIEHGQSAPAHWKVDRHYQRIYVQADPANRALKFFDEKNHPITPEKLNQNVQRGSAKVITWGQQPKKRIKNSQHA